MLLDTLTEAEAGACGSEDSVFLLVQQCPQTLMLCFAIQTTQIFLSPLTLLMEYLHKLSQFLRMNLFLSLGNPVFFLSHIPRPPSPGGSGLILFCRVQGQQAVLVKLQRAELVPSPRQGWSRLGGCSVQKQVYPERPEQTEHLRSRIMQHSQEMREK